MSKEMSPKWNLPKLSSGSSFYTRRSSIQKMGSTIKVSQKLKESQEQKKKQKTLYNKWYIKPEYRYKDRSQNPKKNMSLLHDEEYVYKNLRNHQFWNWTHPFQNEIPHPKSPQYMEKINPIVMEVFKRHIEESPEKRLPSIVEHILKRKRRSALG